MTSPSPSEAAEARIHEQEVDAQAAYREIARLTAAGLAAEARWADEVEKRREQEEVIQALRGALSPFVMKCEDCGALATWHWYVHETDYYYCDVHMPEQRRRNDRRIDHPDEVRAREALALSVSSATDGDQHA